MSKACTIENMSYYNIIIQLLKNNMTLKQPHKDYSFCLKLNREAFIFLVNIIQIIGIYIDHIFM